MALNPAIKTRQSPLSPAGEGKGFGLAVLEQGARLLQETTPLHGFDVYVVGFHPAKEDPAMQMEAHHYCRVVNDDFLQCTIFDGNARDANLVGIEYIVSERLFATLPEDERDSWHPHNFEVLSGQLVAPGLPAAAEHAFMKRLMNSYGKTWHTWHTGRHDTGGGHELPVGDAMLMWSFNREGECDPALAADREVAMDLDTAKTREQRQDLVELAHPQRGVDTLKDRFTGTTSVPGVVDAHGGPAPHGDTGS
ncbi:OBAP family protein [Microbacterium sp. CFH 90308]|uniref:OBAP family protein n=1 Tax=Microbacterium salsuginis TaxID=2722803 RepID=A0ABX1KE03_9MICO|nr:OBAP family protein [Microbacterium sp. CFH 90308]NLP84309.1 OBAP family protein [Microbacterium sp. CFH 90308]